MFAVLFAPLLFLVLVLPLTPPPTLAAPAPLPDELSDRAGGNRWAKIRWRGAASGTPNTLGLERRYELGPNGTEGPEMAAYPGQEPRVARDDPKYLWSRFRFRLGRQTTIRVRASGKDWCLDSNTEPANGIRIRVMPCGDGLAEQAWFVRDGRIWLHGTDLCADVPMGDTSYDYIQLWQCNYYTPTQVFDFEWA